jgi:acetyltransferase-like isoleucine patch superfamily enzyme
MELNHRPQIQFLALLIKAFQSRRSEIFQMSRNFILFFVSTYVVRSRRGSRARLKLGENVRLQRSRTIKFIGRESSIEIGNHSIVYENARLEAVGQGIIRIGNCGVLGDCRISAREKISIGDRVLLSWNVFIQDYDSHPLVPEIRAEQVKRICHRFYPRFSKTVPEVNEELLQGWTPPSEPVVIGNDVWFGAGAIVLKGARIGDGCVVAGGSVVTAGDYPARSVIAGNPARVVKSIPAAEVLS